MPDHRHTITDPGHTHSLPFSGAALTGVGPSDDVTQGGSAFSTGSASTGITGTNYTGGTGSSESNQPGGAGVTAAAHENMQPTLFIGNTFIYAGKPTYGTWTLAYPPYGAYGGMPAII